MVLDQLYAPLYYRLTMQHEPLGPALADALVRTLLDGIRPRGTAVPPRAGVTGRTAVSPPSG